MVRIKKGIGCIKEGKIVAERYDCAKGTKKQKPIALQLASDTHTLIGHAVYDELSDVKDFRIVKEYFQVVSLVVTIPSLLYSLKRK